MKRNIIWKGIKYQSLENCILTVTDKGSEINSSVIGAYNNTPFKLDYRITTNQFWETTFFEMKYQLHDTIQVINFQRDGKGNWFKNGTPADLFNECFDIDISLTPLTNTLPINRLKLTEKQNKQIKVIYIDVLAQQTVPIFQKYTKLSDAEYKYENVPNDFESVVTVDRLGLVVTYPGLFKRVSITESNYQ